MAVITISERVTFIQRVFGTYRISRDSKNVDVRCPICDPKDHTKLKLSILTVDAMPLHCWTCGYRSRTLWKMIADHGTREQLIEYRDRFLPESFRRHTYEREEEKEEKLQLPKDFKLLATASLRDPDVIALKKYLVLRRISERDEWFYKLGYSDEPQWRRRVIVPSFDASGEVNWFVARAIDRFRRPKYDAPHGKRTHVIFNEVNIDWTKKVVLCEGTFDMMKCGDNTIPMLGSDIDERSALFNAIIVNKTPVALALDADMRTTKLPRLVKKLSSFNVEVDVVDVKSDPGDMTKQEFKDALSMARPLAWEQSFLDRLDGASKISL